MTLKLKPRERQLSAVAIGNIKLAQTATEYAELHAYLDMAAEAISQMRRSVSGTVVPATSSDGDAAIKLLVDTLKGDKPNDAFDDHPRVLLTNEKPKVGK